MERLAPAMLKLATEWDERAKELDAEAETLWPNPDNMEKTEGRAAHEGQALGYREAAKDLRLVLEAIL